MASICIALAAPTVQAAPPPQEDRSPTEEAQASPAAEPGVEAARPSVVQAETPPAQTQSTLDAAWAGVEGYDVRIVLDDATSHVGRVSAVQATTFTLIDYDGGIVRVIPKATVRDLRVRVPDRTSAPPLPDQNGGGLIAGGIVLTVIGTPVFLSGLVILGLAPDGSEIHLPLLLSGGAALAGGIPLIVIGSRRRQAYRKALHERSMPTPTLGFGRHGWTAGLRLRF